MSTPASYKISRGEMAVIRFVGKSAQDPDLETEGQNWSK